MPNTVTAGAHFRTHAPASPPLQEQSELPAEEPAHASCALTHIHTHTFQVANWPPHSYPWPAYSAEDIRAASTFQPGPAVELSL
eukprot:scaffold311432_cov23-Tisochrysis_lutea.AAC.1